MKIREQGISRVKLLCCLALLILLSSCAVITRMLPWVETNPLKRIILVSMPDSNSGYSVEVDVVFVTDENLAKPISALTATQWFEEKNRYLEQYRKDVKVKHFEPMPSGSKVIKKLPSKHERAKIVMVFAHYIEPSDTTGVDISQYKKARVVLKDSMFVVEEGDE